MKFPFVPYWVKDKQDKNKEFKKNYTCTFNELIKLIDWLIYLQHYKCIFASQQWNACSSSNGQQKSLDFSVIECTHFPYACAESGFTLNYREELLTDWLAD